MKSETTTQLKRGIGAAGWILAAALAIVLGLVLTGVQMPFGVNPETTNSSDQPAPDKGRVSGEGPKEREARLNGTEFYNDETPASKLAELYTDALSEAVKNKDVNGCQTGLKNFSTKLSTMPWAVRINLDERHSANGWKIPTSTTFLTPDHINYACQQATRVDSMSSLVPDDYARRAMAVIDSDDVVVLKGGSRVCFDLLSIDYRHHAQHTTPAGRVMLSLLSPALPKELTDEQFATLCDYKLPKV